MAKEKILANRNTYKVDINHTLFVRNQITQSVWLDVDTIDIVKIFYLAVRMITPGARVFSEFTLSFSDYFSFVEAAKAQLKPNGKRKKSASYKGGNQRKKLAALLPELRKACIVINDEAIYLFDTVKVEGNCFVLKINDALRPYLLGIETKKHNNRYKPKKQYGYFTTLNLAVILSFNSIRKYKMYAFLRSFCNLDFAVFYKLTFPETRVFFGFSDDYQNCQIMWQLRQLVKELRSVDSKLAEATVNKVRIEDQRAVDSLEFCTHRILTDEERKSKQEAMMRLWNEEAKAKEEARAESFEAEQQELMMMRIVDDIISDANVKEPKINNVAISEEQNKKTKTAAG